MQDAMKEKLQLDEKAQRERVQGEKQLKFELKLHEAKAKLQSEIIPEVSTSIRAGSKFAYLRQLLCDKARKTIEALPHTAERYNRAISILKDRFGKESKVVKTFVKEIPTANTFPQQTLRKYMISIKNCLTLCNPWKHLSN